MNENPSIKIELSAHTDSRGSDSYNRKLSQNRAESTVNYLIDHGISHKRLIATGYGESRLINKCLNDVYCTNKMHEQNRRVELKVL